MDDLQSVLPGKYLSLLLDSIEHCHLQGVFETCKSGEIVVVGEWPVEGYRFWV